MEGSQSLDELAEYFNKRLELMTKLLMLRDVYSDEGDLEMLCNLRDSISDLKTILFSMRMQVDKQKQELSQFQEIKEQILQLATGVHHAKDNLPAKLPTANQPVAQSKQRISEMNGSSSATHQPAAMMKKEGPYIPSMTYVTIDEFSTIPKYMKGRVTYEQMNNAVDEFNKALTTKYEILYTTKSGQTEQIKKKIMAFKKQDCKDSKGTVFLTEDDLCKLSSLRMDNISRSILTMLRHIGKLKLVRGSGFTRHALS